MTSPDCQLESSTIELWETRVVSEVILLPRILHVYYYFINIDINNEALCGYLGIKFLSSHTKVVLINEHSE